MTEALSPAAATQAASPIQTECPAQAEPLSPPARPTSPGRSLVAALCLGSGVLATIGAAWWGERRLQAELTMRPPLVVMDYAPLAAALGAGASPEVLQRVFAMYKDNAARFQHAGFMVLTRVAVEAVPEGLTVPTPPLPIAAPEAAPALVSPASSSQLPAPDQLRRAPPDAASQSSMSREEATALLRGLLGAGRR